MKKLIISLLFVFLFSLSFTSCNKQDINFKDYQTVKKEQFSKNFTETFGIPAADHTWGFENIELFDYTKSASTRAHDVNRNEWASKYVIPANVTSAEEQAVLNKLAEGAGDRDKNITIPWTDFFVYQVHKSNEIYNDHSGASIGAVSSKLNHLQCGDGTVQSDGTLVGTWEHINDFNNGNSTGNWGQIKGATLMISSSSKNFAYHNTVDSKYHDTYTVIDGATIGYPGFYYVCFDFLANGDIEQPANKNMGVDRNYNYTDWIIRVSPAIPLMNGAVRIIAEDLGAENASDFDYNDVVFDAKVANEWVASENANKLVAYIVLQAAGGTLPLTVGGQEVHNMFGVSTGTMVNTGLVSRSPVPFKVILGDATWEISGADAVKSIPVVVKNGNNIVTLACETGKAPEKIAVPTTFQWCSERTPIQNVYPTFYQWVLDKSVIWWN